MPSLARACSLSGPTRPRAQTAVMIPPTQHTTLRLARGPRPNEMQSTSPGQFSLAAWQPGSLAASWDSGTPGDHLLPLARRAPAYLPACRFLDQEGPRGTKRDQEGPGGTEATTIRFDNAPRVLGAGAASGAASGRLRCLVRPCAVRCGTVRCAVRCGGGRVDCLSVRSINQSIKRQRVDGQSNCRRAGRAGCAMQRGAVVCGALCRSMRTVAAVAATASARVAIAATMMSRAPRAGCCNAAHTPG